jgi:hypothetical protein
MRQNANVGALLSSLSPTKPCSQAQGRGSDLQSNVNSQAGDLSILDAAELDVRNYEVHARDARPPPKQYASTQRGSAYESGYGTIPTLISRTRSADAGTSSQPTSRMVNSADQPKRPLPAKKPQLSSLARSFVSLGPGEYSATSHFISDNLSIVAKSEINASMKDIQNVYESIQEQGIRIGQQSQRPDSEPQDRKLLVVSQTTERIVSQNPYAPTPRPLETTKFETPVIRDREGRLFYTDKQGNVLRPASSRHSPDHAPEPNRHNSAENDLPTSFKQLSIGDSKPKLSSVVEHPGPGLQNDTNSQADDISILDAAGLDIRGNRGDHEESGHRYYRKFDGKKFFAVGRVFAMLWYESVGGEKGGLLSRAEPFNVQNNSKRKRKCNEEMDLGTDIGNPADKVLHLGDYMWNCV